MLLLTQHPINQDELFKYIFQNITHHPPINTQTGHYFDTETDKTFRMEFKNCYLQIRINTEAPFHQITKYNLDNTIAEILDPINSCWQCGTVFNIKVISHTGENNDIPIYICKHCMDVLYTEMWG